MFHQVTGEQDRVSDVIVHVQTVAVQTDKTWSSITNVLKGEQRSTIKWIRWFITRFGGVQFTLSLSISANVLKITPSGSNGEFPKPF
jgi:hypothetical protein